MKRFLPTSAMLLLAVVLAASGAGQQTAEKILNIVVTWEPVVGLTWDPSSSVGVVGYNVYRSDISGGSYARLNAEVIPALTYDDETVEKLRTYFYVVTAVRVDNVESVKSNEAIAVVPLERGS